MASNEKVTSEGAQARPRMRLWLRIVLFVSLALNLAIVGLVVGAISKGPRDHHRPPRLDQASGPLTYALSREDRRALGGKLREAYRDGHPTREKMRAQFDAMLQALRRVPFDPAPLAASLEQQRTVALERQLIGQTLLLEKLTQMSDAERAEFAERLEEALEHRGGREGRHKDH